MNAAGIASGGNFSSPAFFSLGLGPWMGATIIWHFLGIDRLADKRKYSEKATGRARGVLMIIFAVFQAISLMSNYQVKSGTAGASSGFLSLQTLGVIILVLGSLAVVWLANQNKDKGLGGMTMFILYQIIASSISNFSSLSGAAKSSQFGQIITVISIACIVVLIVSIVTWIGELRLHVNKISIDSGYTGMSYVPIKLNPVGASPIMYGMTLLILPSYIAHAFSMIQPSAAAGSSSNNFFSVWSLTNPVGISVYLVLLFVLSIFFGLFTITPKGVSEQMKNSGEYFDRIPPGEPTRRYIRKRVAALSAINGVFLVVFTGLPLFYMEIDQNLSFLFMLPGTILILVNLILSIWEEFADLMIGTKYS
jgi:preprotein translocase subunit SecY